MTFFRRIFLGFLGLVLLLVIAGGAGFWYMSRHGGVEIREDGLVGRFYAPTDAENRTAVLMLGGSNGGFPYDKAAQSLGDAGYPTFALAYFKDYMKQPDGLPEGLVEIPLEYFFAAIDWMKERPEVNADKIVLMGESRGGELVLLLASHRADVAGVIAYSPSHVVWQGVGESASPAWTLDGEPVPFLTSTYIPERPLVDMFEVALAETPVDRIAEAAIPVENIQGPVLLISSTADKIWPAVKMADAIEARLKANAFGFPITNLQYDDASHLLMGYGPGMVKFSIPFIVEIEFGGSPEGTRAARDDGWEAAIDFLERIDD